MTAIGSSTSSVRLTGYDQPAPPPAAPASSAAPDPNQVEYSGDATGALRLLQIEMKSSESAQKTGEENVEASANQAKTRRAEAELHREDAKKANEKSGMFGKWGGALEVVAVAATAASAVATGGATAVIAAAALAAKAAAMVAKKEGASGKLVEGLEIGSAVGMAAAGGVGALSGAASAASATATTIKTAMTLTATAASAGSGTATGIKGHYDAKEVDCQADAKSSSYAATDASKDGDEAIERMTADQKYLTRFEKTAHAVIEGARSAKLDVINNIGKAG